MKKLHSNREIVLICTSPINLNLNYKFVKTVVNVNNGKTFHIRFHPRLKLDFKNINLNGVKPFDPHMQYFNIYTWPSSVIDEYWNEEVSIHIYRPNISPYIYQESYYYKLPNIVVAKNLNEIT